MPTARARYDVLYNDGSGMSVGDTGRNRAVIDMAEERTPDDWGDPGRLVSARLARWYARDARSIEYAPVGRRMALWIDNTPRLTRSSRRYLRWELPDDDPTPHDDPLCEFPP
jgi:hypothetical protein